MIVMIIITLFFSRLYNDNMMMMMITDRKIQLVLNVDVVFKILILHGIFFVVTIIINFFVFVCSVT